MLAFGLGIAAIALTAWVIYRLGRSSKTIEEKDKDLAVTKTEKEILVAQRDDRINTVDDADRLFNSIRKDK